MLAIIEWEESTGSISSSELSRKLNISYPTAWSMLMKMRTYMNNGLDKNEIFSGIIEADEAWFGRKNNQDIVLGMVERNRRKLKLFIIENVKEETLYPIIEKNVKYGSDFYTDCRITYAITGIYYNHKTTNHSQGEFARNNVHSNTIEQIWGDIKGIIRTIHHGISKKYRHLYLAQYVFKYQFFHITNFFFKTLFTLFLPTYCLY
jgi:transposase-like protein